MINLQFWKSDKSNIPNFYKEYAALFANQKVQLLDETRYVVFDTETTGLDVRNDRMLSIGAISIIGNVIDVSDALERYVKQDVFSEESVAIHGILRQSKYEQITEEEAVKEFLSFIGNSVLVGHHVGFDVKIINYALKRLGAPKLKNKLLDTGILYKRTIHVVNMMSREKHYSLDELCEELKIAKTDRHKASGDAFITAMAFLKIKSKLLQTGKFTTKELYKPR
ncbi:MAG: 3'-5' exonuclease [Leeuwenhoekiella sp.]